MPATGDTVPSAVAHALEAGTVGAVDGVAVPQGEGSANVPAMSSPDSTPDANANSLLLRLRESEAAVAMHKAQAQALQREIALKQSGHRLSDEQLSDLRQASDKREEFSQARLERGNQFIQANRHVPVDDLGRAHEALMLAGYEDESPGYHSALEKQFGPLKRILPPGALEDDRNPNISYGAPVSRSESHNYSGHMGTNQTKIRLTPEEVEAANFSGVSQEEFARQKIKMQDYKRRGLIQDTGGR